MKSAKPLISVIMAVFNGEKYLHQAIKSVLEQTVADFEFVIINDTSTDNSINIIKSFNDSRIKLINNGSNIGLTKSLNKGIHFAKGRYIARQDADDISLPERFSLQITYFTKHPEAVLVSGEMETIDEHGKVISQSNLASSPIITRWYLLFYNRIGGHSQVMFRRNIVEKIGGYNENFRYTQDYELWLRLVQHHDLIILPEKLIQYRHNHPDSLSATKAEEQTHLALIASQVFQRNEIHLSFPLPEIDNMRRFWTEEHILLADYLSALKNIPLCFRKFKKRYFDQLNYTSLQIIKYEFIQRGNRHLYNLRPNISLLLFVKIFIQLAKISPYLTFCLIKKKTFNFIANYSKN